MSTVTFALRTRTFRSLRRHHNYRLFFAGQIVSLAGSWMQNVALAGSCSRSRARRSRSRRCSSAGSCRTPLFGLFAGSVVDRLDTRRLVIWTQVAAMLDLGGARRRDPDGHGDAARSSTCSRRSAASPSCSTRRGGSHSRSRWSARASCRTRLLSTRGSSTPHASSAPRSPGSLIAVAGVGVCFLVNTLSFVAVLAALLAMREDELYPVAARSHRHPARRARGKGWRSRGATAQVRVVLVVVTCVGLVGFNFNTLVPLLASDTLHVDARAFGLLSAAFGLGAFVGRDRHCVVQAGDVPRVHRRNARVQHPPARARARSTRHGWRGSSSSASAPRSRSSPPMPTRSSSSPHPTISAGGSSRSTCSRSSASRRSARSCRARSSSSEARGSPSSSAAPSAWPRRRSRPPASAGSRRPSNEGASADANPPISRVPACDKEELDDDLREPRFRPTRAARSAGAVPSPVDDRAHRRPRRGASARRTSGA